MTRKVTVEFFSDCDTPHGAIYTYPRGTFIGAFNYDPQNDNWYLDCQVTDMTRSSFHELLMDYPEGLQNNTFI